MSGTALPGPREGCGYAVSGSDRSIPSTDPVVFGGWWVRIGYLSSADQPVVVTAGDATYSTVLKAGVHALYFQAAVTGSTPSRSPAWRPE